MFVCWCRCVIKVCEGWGPCSRGQIDCRHVNYRRQATCVTFFHLSAHTFPPFLRWLILPQHSFFFSLKLSEIHSASLCLALCSAGAEVWRERSVSIFLIGMAHSASVCVNGRYSSSLAVEDVLSCVKSSPSPWVQNYLFFFLLVKHKCRSDVMLYSETHRIEHSAAVPLGICDTHTDCSYITTTTQRHRNQRAFRCGV